MPESCPCGGVPPGAAYAHCCGRWHAGVQLLLAPDAATLMRSRYSAFVRGDVAYLLATWHPTTRPATLDWEPGVRWLGLALRCHERLDDQRATVEFVARCRGASGRAQRLHECSRFVLEDGRWFYVDGDHR